jgi:hypothetical protein
VSLKYARAVVTGSMSQRLYTLLNRLQIPGGYAKFMFVKGELNIVGLNIIDSFI